MGSVTRRTRYEESSYWARDCGAYEPSPPLEGDLRADVAVIGAGYTGLNTAREVRRDDPGAEVAVLEAAVVGYGASGRNGGFSMKLFGLEPEWIRLRWGRQRTIEAHRYAQRAVAYLKELVEDHALDSDYRHTGMLRVAYSTRQLRRLEKTHALFQELGIDEDMSFHAADALRERFGTERFLGGLHERETGLLHPCKHVRELKRLALEAGARVYEETPVLWISRASDGVVLRTPGGSVRASKLVLATNAYSRTLRGLPKLRSRQVPVWTFQVVTEPLTAAQWEAIGWREREAFEDNRQLIHYFRPTVDGRITMGGGDVLAPYGDDLDRDFAPRIWRHCEEHLRWLFPALADVPIAYRWGGPVSVNADLTPEIGTIGDERVLYSTGCIGHGVSLTHLNGRLLADLVAGKQTELTEFWIVNRRAIPWPPEPFSTLGRQLVRHTLRAWDAFEERELRRARRAPTAS